MADKNQMEKVYEAIEKARSTGKIRKGTNETTKAIEKGEAKLVVAAKDTSPPEIIMHIPELCKERNILFANVDSKADLGAAAGLSVGCSCVTIVREGEAKEIIKDIAESQKAVQKAE